MSQKVPRAYYNEYDAYAAAWLRNLIAEGLIPDGDVDERSIVDVRPDDLAGYVQCHFFAGIGGWSLAARLAGWPDDRPLWTGSCPCQPFSVAGRKAGFDDERHLWPVFHQLIDTCRPEVVMGEQVASKDGLVWLDAVFADLEGAGYLADAVDLCAAGVGAPQIRQRLWWIGKRLAGTDCGGWPEGRTRAEGVLPVADGGAGRLVDGVGAGSQGRPGPGDMELRGGAEPDGPARPAGTSVGLARASLRRQHDEQGNAGEQEGARERGREPVDGRGDGGPGPTDGFWRDADWLYCRDGKWRPVEPGTFPLAHGVPARVGRLRAYGNAIVPQVAAEVIGAYLDTERIDSLLG